MIERYSNPRISEIWSDENKFSLWQGVELAFLLAQVIVGDDDIAMEDYFTIDEALNAVPIDAEEIRQIETRTRHDLNAFLEERRQHIPSELQHLFHKGNTSYDVEEPAMALMLRDSYKVVSDELSELQKALYKLAHQHRYTVMIARTHGQGAELQSFGKRLLGYVQDLNVDVWSLQAARRNLEFSKFSGATGNYTTISPSLEKETLAELDLQPYYGATQTMPREIYAPLATALAQLCQTIHKIALTIRLSSRSGRPFCHEPFGKGQTGSSAMPHKKNPIVSEQLEGMARMALGYATMLVQNIPTWEERSIEQSCVERVAWPDLFHITVHSLRRLTAVISDLVVYPENMLLEVVESGGLYASNEAKGLLKEMGKPFGLTDEEAYRIVQLAAFNVFEIRQREQVFTKPETLEGVDDAVKHFRLLNPDNIPDFKDKIECGDLKVSEQQPDQKVVDRWNNILDEIFKDEANLERWEAIFRPSHILRNESVIYDSVAIEIPY